MKVYWYRKLYAKTALRWLEWLLIGEGIDIINYKSDVSSAWQTIKEYITYKIIDHD